MPELANHVALAIYTAFVRERDPDRALYRFKRLKPAIRQQFINEAEAAISVVAAYTGAQA